MKHRRVAIAGIVAAVFLGTAPVLGAAGDEALPGGAEVKQLVDGGKYRDALKDLLRILALKGPAAEPYDRYDMLMLKGESQLQLHQKDGALATFALARDEAVTEKKPERLAMPMAMLELVGHSPTYAYKPKSGGDAISVLDREKRKDAFAALLADELPGVKAKMDALAKVTSMGPVVEASKVVGILRAVEIAGTGDSAETSALVAAVRGDAYRLMEPVVEDMQGHVELIGKHAQQQVTENMPQVDMNSGKSWMQQVTHLRGPSGEERNSLGKIVGTCEKISGASRQVAQALGTEFEAMEEIAGKADGIKKEAGEILGGDYTSPVKKE